MSGPRARMGQNRLFQMQLNSRGALCQLCIPSPGWGWEMEDYWGDPHDDAKLPPPGNGFMPDGPCRWCDGKGIDLIPWSELFRDGRKYQP